MNPPCQLYSFIKYSLIVYSSLQVIVAALYGIITFSFSNVGPLINCKLGHSLLKDMHFNPNWPTRFVFPHYFSNAAAILCTDWKVLMQRLLTLSGVEAEIIIKVLNLLRGILWTNLLFLREKWFGLPPMCKLILPNLKNLPFPQEKRSTFREKYFKLWKFIVADAAQLGQNQDYIVLG